MSAASWEKRFGDAYRSAEGRRRNIKLPRDIGFDGDERVLKLQLRNGAPNRNMQTDSAAFEAWALIARSWLDVSHVVLEWERPAQPTGHYARFLYRVVRFLEAFPWFEVAESSRPLLDEVPAEKELWFNRAARPRTRPRATRVALSSPERTIEGHIASTEEVTRRLLQAAKAVGPLRNQLPVGVFRNAVKKENALFAANASAVDLWAMGDDGRLHIFELKNSKNTKVGAISELFFYSMVLRDSMTAEARPPLTRFAASPNHDDAQRITTANGTTGWLLAPRFHPLIDGNGGKLIATANEGLTRLPLPVDFRLMRVDEGWEFSQL